MKWKWISDVCLRPSCRKWLIGIGAAFVLYGIFGFFVLPGILLPVVQDAISNALHRKTVIRELRVNPLFLAVTIKGLEISERDDPGKWIAAEEIYLNLQLASILRMGPVFSEIRIVSPYVNIIRDTEESYNFSDILEESAKKPKGKPLKYSLNNIEVIDGQVDFLDGAHGTGHKIEEIHIAIPFISNSRYSANKYIQPSFSAIVNGDAVSIKGKTKLFDDSLETSFDIDIANMSLPKYIKYVPFRMEYEVPSALLDVRAVLSFLQRNVGRPTISIEGEMELHDVRVTMKDKSKSPMIFLPSVKVVALPSDVGSGEYHLASLTIRDPEIDAVINRNNKLNLYALTPENTRESSGAKKEKASASTGETSPGGLFSIDSIRLSGGKVRFSDLSSGHAPFRTVLSDIRISVDDFSTAKGKSANAEVYVSTEAGETIDVKSTFSVLPVVSAGVFSAKKLAPARYAPYYMDRVLFGVMRGTFDLESGYEFSQSPEETSFRLHGLALSIDGLRLRHKEETEDFLYIPSFRVKDAQVDSQSKELTVEEISTEKGRVWIRRLSDGVINVSRLASRKEEAAESLSESPAESTVESPAKPEDEKPWTVALRKISVDGYGVRIDDRTTSPPVEIAFDDMRFSVEGFTTEKNHKGTFSFATAYNRAGRLSLDGVVSMDPPTAGGMLRARNISIGALHPYFAENVKILVTGGDMSMEGMLRVSVPEGAPLQVGYKGWTTINGFASVDKEQGDEFLSFRTLRFNGMDVSYPPANILLDEIALSDFYSRIIVYDNASLNIQNVMGKSVAKDNVAAPEAAVSKKEEAGAAGKTTVWIDALTLQNGRVDFNDRHIIPNYSTSMVGLKGRVSGISSEEVGRANVDLEGSLGHGTPLEIKGMINPLAKDLFLDLDVGFKGIDLSPLTPYSGRYAGYGIEKGKLTLNLSYHIEKRKLDARNKLFLDQFTFGNPVDSPDATHLPVKMAVSILKDRNGEIHVDLPVSGDLDNPHFSFWGIVWQAVRNLLMKAATAPFALMGSLFGDAAEQLSYLEFEPGSSEISQAGEEKVRNLYKALYDRPALRLEIVGHADPDADARALRRAAFRYKVAAWKVKSMVEAGLPPPLPDSVEYQPGEYDKFLKLAYKEEKIPKPRNILGMAKDLPASEMEKLMITNIKVTEGDLRQLAVDRAARVRAALVSGGDVEPGRVFLVEPKTVAPQKKDNVKDSRVEFTIR